MMRKRKIMSERARQTETEKVEEKKKAKERARSLATCVLPIILLNFQHTRSDSRREVNGCRPQDCVSEAPVNHQQTERRFRPPVSLVARTLHGKERKRKRKSGRERERESGRGRE